MCEDGVLTLTADTIAPERTDASSLKTIAAERLTLSDFRCYSALRLDLDARIAVLHGPNGAGKTNLLEALSFLSPGRGLRRARLGSVTRHGTRDGWSVAARFSTANGELTIGTGIEAEETRRSVRIDGKNVSGPAALAERLGVQWLTPQMDRLFLEGPGPRRRFLDRLVYGSDPGHARRVSDYEKSMRERSRLLREGGADPVWLNALEAEMAANGVAIAAARRHAVGLLEGAIADSSGAFPRAELRTTGTVERWLETIPAVDAEAKLAEALRDGRRRDAESGGATEGPHRSDLEVRHAATGATAETCSTGEQKALLITIVLANTRLEAARRGTPPLLLLDEVAAHLDQARRSALFEEILNLGAQTWLTGTDRNLFDYLHGRAQFMAVHEATVTVEEE